MCKEIEIHFLDKLQKEKYRKTAKPMSKKRSFRTALKYKLEPYKYPCQENQQAIQARSEYGQFLDGLKKNGNTYITDCRACINQYDQL